MQVECSCKDFKVHKYAAVKVASPTKNTPGSIQSYENTTNFWSEAAVDSLYLKNDSACFGCNISSMPKPTKIPVEAVAAKFGLEGSRRAMKICIGGR